MDEYYSELGRKIRELRESNGLTQEELAKLLGNYSASAISYFEKGARYPRVGEISKIAEIFQVDVQNLLPKADVSTPEAIKFRKEKTGLKNIDLTQMKKDIKNKTGLKKIKGDL